MPRPAAGLWMSMKAGCCFTSWSSRSTVPAMPGYVEKLSVRFSVVSVSVSVGGKRG